MLACRLACRVRRLSRLLSSSSSVPFHALFASSVVRTVAKPSARSRACEGRPLASSHFDRFPHRSSATGPISDNDKLRRGRHKYS